MHCSRAAALARELILFLRPCRAAESRDVLGAAIELTQSNPMRRSVMEKNHDPKSQPGSNCWRHRSSASRIRHQAGEGLSRVPRCGRHGEMAAAQRLHLQGPPYGPEGRRHIQDVVHQFHDKGGPCVQRRISGDRAQRASSLHRSLRRPQSARSHRGDRDPESGFGRNRDQHRTGQHSGGDSGRSLLSGLAAVATQLALLVEPEIPG